ncbi:hypothetical protein BDY24DRAFT_432851 [Mrakia frigida]|uniref:uncharacterized protein n=1 Tax=Mrakia frigida TaxID=29902 RepID=UPI003FCC0AB5
MTSSSQIYGTSEHPYSTLPETKKDLPWADLVALDLSLFDQPGGKETLAKQLKTAVHDVGFFYVVNFGISQERVDKQFAIGKEVFDLPFAEKEPFAADHANGGYNGYTGRELNHFKNQNTDGFQRNSNIEVWNAPKVSLSFIPEFDEWHAAHRPAPVAANWDEIQQFGKDVHDQVVKKLLVIFAHVLELDDKEYFVKRHEYDVQSEDHLRYMKYKVRSEKENDKANGLYTGGHTDLGSITLLFRQPVVGLQVLAHDGTWHFVKPLPGSITVNIADTLQILSGTYLKSSVHRVIAPQQDQAQLDRLGVLYFVRPNNQVLVEAVKNSPVLLASGSYEKVKDEAWRRSPSPFRVRLSSLSLSLSPRITRADNTLPPTPSSPARAAWVKARQASLFSKENQERYTKLMDKSVPAGTEKKELSHIVAGIPVKYWA